METKSALLLIDIQNDYFEGGSNPLHGSLEAGIDTIVLLSGMHVPPKTLKLMVCECMQEMCISLF